MNDELPALTCNEKYTLGWVIGEKIVVGIDLTDEARTKVLDRLLKKGFVTKDENGDWRPDELQVEKLRYVED